MSYSEKYIDNAYGNKFLTTIYDLYDAVHFSSNDDFEDKYTKYTDYIGGWVNGIPITRKKKIKINTKAQEAYNNALSFAEEIKNTVPDFDTLFNFSSFIRSMETVFFYKNDDKATIAADYALHQDLKRNVYINKPDITIVVALEKEFNKDTIELSVYRNYGKKMYNKFHIENRDVDYSYTDDLYLINNVNVILQEEMYKFYIQWVMNIVKGYNFIEKF